MSDVNFKTCPKCGQAWQSRSDFLSDKDIELRGYQVNMEELEAGLLLFTHLGDNCFTTMSLHVAEFDDLYHGARYTENKALSEECPRFCLDKEMMERCNAKCECAFIREIIHVITAARKK